MQRLILKMPLSDQKGEKNAEEGIHKELMRKKGEYYELYNKEG